MISSTATQHISLGGQLSGYSRLSRRRTLGACTNCRARRVRCDAVGSGAPCTNCAAFSLICTGSMRQVRRRKEAQKLVNRDEFIQENGENISALHPMQLLEHHLMQEADDINLYVQFMKPEIRHAPINEPGRVAYIGESTNFSLLVDDDPRSFQLVHYQLPENSRDSRAKLIKMGNAEVDILRQRGALSLPPWRLCDALIESYFKWVAPVLPVINQSRFMRQYRNPDNPPSLLLLQAIFLAGSITWKDGIAIDGIAIPPNTFYKRAKAFFDTDYEDDRIITVQALILIGWYWEKSKDIGQAFYWNGLATTIAQGSGMHRSTKLSPLSKTDKRLWKRIWWTIFARDQSIALLGQLVQVHTKDSDIEMACEDDFIDEEYPPDLLHVQFFLQNVQLCLITNAVLSLQQSTPTKTLSHGATISMQTEMALTSWLKACPKELSWEGSSYNFWSASLCCSYNTVLSFLHRSDLRALHIGGILCTKQTFEGPLHLLQESYPIGQAKIPSDDGCTSS